MGHQIRRLRIAVSGLGRMGARHAHNFLHQTPRAVLVAVFSPDPREISWAKENLGPWGVTIYEDYDEMLKHMGLEAVCIATITSVHAEQSIKAIESGKHVLCEKPLSTELSLCQKVLDSARAHPDLKVMCGFSRRFDSSYLAAYRSTVAGSIGRPTVLRSQTCDKYDASGAFVQYAQFSGGIFVDCNIHDIDLALWFLSAGTPDKALPKVRTVTAVGVAALEPDLVKYGDVDNGVGVVEFFDGQIAYFFSSRMNSSGQHDMTDIIGTTGKLSVNANPASTLMESHTSNGIHRDIPQNFFERFEHAFVKEAHQFVDAVLEDKPTPIDLESSVLAVSIGTLLQESLRSGRKLFFDRAGNRVEEAVRAES